MNFKPTKSVMKTLTLEEFGPEQRTMLSDLHQETRTKLEENGVKELLPV